MATRRSTDPTTGHISRIASAKRYPRDDGPLTDKQIQQIKKRVPQGEKASVRSSLFKAQPKPSP